MLQPSTPLFGTQSVPSSIPIQIPWSCIYCLSKTLDLAIRVDLVVLEHSQLGLLALVLDLLGGGVDLLLALLGTTTQAEDQVEGALLLDVVVAQGAAILELLASKDKSLLVGGNALLVLDLGLDVVDGVGRLHLKGDGLPRKGLDEDLHLASTIIIIAFLSNPQMVRDGLPM